LYRDEKNRLNIHYYLIKNFDIRSGDAYEKIQPESLDINYDENCFLNLKAVMILIEYDSTDESWLHLFNLKHQENSIFFYL
jgi:hypothetical protein